MKRPGFCFLSLLLAVILMSGLCTSAFGASKEITGDDFIVDTLDGVPAYPTRQCNELAIRYYEEVLGAAIFVGDYSPFLMSNYFLLGEAEDLSDIPDELSGFKHTDTPKKGDIVFWSAARRGKSYAHTALVKSYANGVITLIEQNWNYNGKAAYERQVKFPSEEYVVYTLPGDPPAAEPQPSVPVDEPDRAAVPVSHSSHKVTLNGAPVSPEAYLIQSENYFKLRDIAMLLSGTGSRFEVTYIPATKAITVTTGANYTPVGGELEPGEPAGSGIHSSSQLWVNGTAVSLNAYHINGNNYFRLVELGEVLGFDVTYEPISKTVQITTR